MTIEILPLGRLLLRLLHAACGAGCRLAILPFFQFLQILHTGGTPFKVGSMVLTAVSTLYLLFRHRVVVSFRREINSLSCDGVHHILRILLANCSAAYRARTVGI